MKKSRWTFLVNHPVYNTISYTLCYVYIITFIQMCLYVATAAKVKLNSRPSIPLVSKTLTGPKAGRVHNLCKIPSLISLQYVILFIHVFCTYCTLYIRTHPPPRGWYFHEKPLTRTSSASGGQKKKERHFHPRSDVGRRSGAHIVHNNVCTYNLCFFIIL